MADIQKKTAKCVKRNPASRYFNAKKDKKTIAAWRLDLDEILQVFKVCSIAWVMTVANFPPPEGTHNNHRCTHFCRSP